MGRAKFLESEDKDMWKFLYTELKKRNASANTPCGNTIWEKYIAIGKSDRSATNLSSHFRKKMFGNLHVAPLKLEDKIFIYKSLNIKIDNRVKYTLEAAHKVKIKFKPFAQIPVGYEDDNDEDSVDDREADNASIVVEESDHDDSILLDENEPCGSKNSGAKASASTAKQSVGAKKNNNPSMDSVLDPDVSLVDPEDHDYTREIREVKAQCRVRHGFPKVLDETVQDNGEQPKKRKKTGGVASPAQEPVQDPFDSSFEYSREMEADLDFGLGANQPAALSEELQDGQHKLMVAENEIPSTISPSVNQLHDYVPFDALSTAGSANETIAFRLKYRKKLQELCEVHFGKTGDGLGQEINLLEAGIYKKAKSYEEYRSTMLKQAKLFASTAETFRSALRDKSPSTASNSMLRLATVDTKINAGDRKAAVLRMVSQFERLPKFFLTIACGLIQVAERCAALHAVDKEDYDDWMKTFDGGIKNSLRELMTDGLI